MKMYILDENGQVVFEFNGNTSRVHYRERQRLLAFVKIALEYLRHA